MAGDGSAHAEGKSGQGVKPCLTHEGRPSGTAQCHRVSVLQPIMLPKIAGLRSMKTYPPSFGSPGSSPENIDSSNQASAQVPANTACEGMLGEMEIRLENRDVRCLHLGHTIAESRPTCSNRK